MDGQEATKRFYDLIWPHRSAILRTAQLLAGSIHEAEDLSQETMLKAFKAVDRFQAGTDAKSWLMTILRNTRIDRLRVADGKKALSLNQLSAEPTKAVAPEADQAEGAWENPQEILDQFADREIIGALQCLAEEIRWTLLLVDVEGLDHQQAATVLDVPVGTIKSRAHRGRMMLREALLPLAKDRRLIRG